MKGGSSSTRRAQAPEERSRRDHSFVLSSASQELTNFINIVSFLTILIEKALMYIKILVHVNNFCHCNSCYNFHTHYNQKCVQRYIQEKKVYIRILISVL